MRATKRLRRRRARPRRQLSKEERERRRKQRRFWTDVRTVFANAGFTYVSTRDREFAFEGRLLEIDAICLTDNVIVLIEETTLATSGIGDHIRKKAEVFEHVKGSQRQFLDVLRAQFEGVDDYFSAHPEVDIRQYILKFVYCSLNDIDESHRQRYGVQFPIMLNSAVQYFLQLGRSIRRSARYEIFKFLDLRLEDIVRVSGRQMHSYPALRLSEVPSGFPMGHNLVSFLVDPDTLLERSYVFRADSWRDQDALYQRLLIKGKLASMRNYLVSEGRVFVNNIIVTLPATAHFTPAPSESAARRPEDVQTGELTVPREFNSIGIVDGQHRVFAYYEGNDQYEAHIARLRKRQHLLVTGIMYPPSIEEDKKREFEARLFLEINDKQKRVRSDLKQSIECIINPYSAVAVAKSVIEQMAAAGPLAGLLGGHFFDVGKIKTASIVSYGLRHIVEIDGESSLFKTWRHAHKNSVKINNDKEGLTDYVSFVATRMNIFVGAFRERVGSRLWTTDRNVSRALSATTINGLVFCMRRLIQSGMSRAKYEWYRERFAHMRIDFAPDRFPYKSSHWRSLGDAIFDQCFARKA